MTYRDDRALARLLLAASPEDPASRARAGLMLAYEGDVDAAEEHCTAALGSPAVGSDAELCLAVVAARRGHDDEALARIGRFLERMPARTQARQLLWYLLTKQQRRDEIRAWVRRLAPRVGLQPDMARALDYAEKTRRAVNPLLLPPKE